ncbi:hypothetical protein LCGC14_3082550, partial [marine sediment metagenome]
GEGSAVEGLAAALGADSEDSGERPPPPPPPTPPRIEDAEPELVPASDPRYQTDRMDSITDDGTLELTDEEPSIPPVSQAAPPAATGASKSRRGLWIWLIAVGLGLIGLVVGGVFAVRALLEGADEIGRAVTQPITTKLLIPVPRPAPTPPTGQAKTRFPLARQVQLATARAPAGAFCLFHVDLARTVKGVARIHSRSDETLRKIAASKLWQDASKRIDEGSMPTSMTLFLIGTSEPAGELFGKFYGALSGGRKDPLEGMWSLTRSDRVMPHFLLRLKGPAAKAYSAELAKLAEALQPQADRPVGGPITCGKLRLSPVGLVAADEMFVGTGQTLSDLGAVHTNAGQQRRL